MIGIVIQILAGIALSAPPADADTRVYFSPKGGCEEAVVRLIANAHNQLDLAVYSINNEAILKALDEAKARGVKVRLLTDHVQAAGNVKVTLELERKGFAPRLHSSGKIMHNKFAVFDHAKVITGSFNWTNPAEQVNEENCVVLDDKAAVAAFEYRFSEHLWVVNTEDKSDRHLAKLKKRVSERAISSKSKGGGP